MSIVLVGSTSGSCTLQEQAVAGTTVLTLPTTSGTVSINGPAFSAYQSSAQSVSASTWTKVTVDTEEFDTNNNYSSSRFTPTVAGYYQVAGSTVYASTTGMSGAGIAKNGSLFKVSNFTSATTVGTSAGISVLVYLNGSTDYVELYTYQTNGTQSTSPSPANVWFTGSLVRGA